MALQGVHGSTREPEPVVRKVYPVARNGVALGHIPRHTDDAPCTPYDSVSSIPIQHMIDVGLAQAALSQAKREMTAKRMNDDPRYRESAQIYCFAKDVCRDLARKAGSTLSPKARAALARIIHDPVAVERIIAFNTEAGRKLPDVLKVLPKKPPGRS